MDDLIEALGIIRKYISDTNERSPLNCVHDELWIMTVDPEDVSEADLKKLKELGFFVDEGAFKSFRFGSA